MRDTRIVGGNHGFKLGPEHPPTLGIAMFHITVNSTASVSAVYSLGYEFREKRNFNELAGVVVRTKERKRA